MNYTFFNKHTGHFGELGADGILAALTAAGVLANKERQALKQGMERMRAGHYFYVGNFIITAVVGGLTLEEVMGK